MFRSKSHHAAVPSILSPNEPARAAVDQSGTASRLANATNMTRTPGSDSSDGEGFVLIGKGTTITGEISNCTVVEIQGTLLGDVAANVLIVREGGVFKGEVQAGQAEIHGQVEGRVTVHGLLDVRSSGRVTGEVTYETLAVAAGAHVAGQLLMPAAINGASAHASVGDEEHIGINGHATNGHDTNGHGIHASNGYRD